MNRLTDWFADNPIAANLLMATLLIGGLTGIGSIDKEMFPAFEQDTVRVSVAYPGAGPREVEQQICMRIEEALDGLEGVERLTCTASLNRGLASVEVAAGFSTSQLLNAVKSRVDSIQTFPVAAERPIVEEARFRQTVISIAVSGDTDERTLKEIAESLRDEISVLPDIPLASVNGTRPYELAIEVPEATLREFGLTLDGLANTISSHSLTVAGGLIRSSSGDIQIQVREQGFSGEDFAQIPVVTAASGRQILLGDIAEIRDGFVEEEQLVRFNGKRAAFIEVAVTENPDVLATAQAVYDFVEERRKTIPDAIELTVWNDSSTYFKARLATLQRSGLMGLLLVFILLLLFLRPALAVWVAVGIATSFIATLFALPIVGTSINMITLFAFILVLGIVVDDAIIIGENIHRLHTRGVWGVKASKLGTREMSSPVFFAVMTSVIVFVPMLFLPGDFARFMIPIAVVPILALLFSLLESLLILPAHLSHLKPEKPHSFFPFLQRARQAIASGLDLFLVRYYRPFLRLCLHHRFLTISSFCATFLVITSLFAGGVVRYTSFPTVPMEFVVSTVIMPTGTPHARLEDIANRMEQAATSAATRVEEETGEAIMKDLFVFAAGNRAEVVVELTSPEERSTPTSTFTRHMEAAIGEIPQAEEVTISGTIDFGGTADIELNLQGNDLDQLVEASAWIEEQLASYADTYNIRNSLNAGRPEMEVVPTSLAATLGITPATLAQQTRTVFFGQEIQRIPRLREDVRVMLRYPADERGSVALLDELRIRTQDQREVPFNAVAQTRFVEGYASTRRIDGRSTITAMADYAETANMPATAVVDDILENRLSDFEQRFPGVSVTLEGAQLEDREFNSAIMRLGALALLVIYGLLAIQFRSLLQPFLILAAIPFGFAGAVVAHGLTGQAINMLSMMGILAAAGVIVNDALVLIDRANNLRSMGFSKTHAIVQAGRDRFRPIFLTSLTTFVGLTPLMLEKSTQAQFLIPMATSLAAGVAAATLVTLVMVPCLYSIVESARARIHARLGRPIPDVPVNIATG